MVCCENKEDNPTDKVSGWTYIKTKDLTWEPAEDIFVTGLCADGVDVDKMPSEATMAVAK